MPTLAEALALCKGKSRVVVELKSYGHNQRLEEKVAAIVEAVGMENDCIFMSMDHTTAWKMKHLRPEWRVGVLVAKAFGDVRTLGADFLAVEARMATPRFVRRAHRAGQDVYVWTVNDPAWMLNALGRGADGLITDRPDLAREVVARRARLTDAAARGGRAADPRRRSHRAVGGRGRTATVTPVRPTSEGLVCRLDEQSAHHPGDRGGARCRGRDVACRAGRRPARAPRRSQRAAGRHLPGRLAALRRVPFGGGTRDGRGQRRARPGRRAVSSRAAGAGLLEHGARGRRNWWALSDNGYAWRGNSADFQLVLYRIDPRWGAPGGPKVLETVVLRDPERHIPWTIACDQNQGSRLPDFSFNVLPATPPACGADPAARILTGFDLDPESLVRSPRRDLLGRRGVRALPGPRRGRRPGAGATGRGARRPLAPEPLPRHLDRALAEAPTVAASRGFEGVAISPDGARLYALLEGAVTGDDPQDLRIYVYELASRAFADRFLTLRLEMPSQQVNLSSLVDASGAPVYPGAVAPPAGPVSIGELKAVNDRQLLVIERDNHGDDRRRRASRRSSSSTWRRWPAHGGDVGKTLLLDLLAIPDPAASAGTATSSASPFYTIESVHVVDERTLLIASDNNFPFSNGRARSRSADRSGPLKADDTELILVRLGAPLDVDRRLLPSAARD